MLLWIYLHRERGLVLTIGFKAGPSLRVHVRACERIHRSSQLQLLGLALLALLATSRVFMHRHRESH